MVTEAALDSGTDPARRQVEFLQHRCDGMGIYGNVAALALGHRLCEYEESAMK